MIPCSWVSLNFVDRLSCMHENIQRFYYTSRKKWTRVLGHGSSQVVTSHKSRVTPIYLQKTQKTSLNKLKDTKKKRSVHVSSLSLILFLAKMESYFTNHTISLKKIQEEFPSKKGYLLEVQVLLYHPSSRKILGFSGNYGMPLIVVPFQI